MDQTLVRCVLFADLRGSTGLYETLGNAFATQLVSRSVSLLGQVISSRDGVLVKTLGDGLMATFAEPTTAMQAAIDMHKALAQIGSDEQADDGRQLPPLKLQVGLAYGEMVEMSGDFFGDAVNIAARLLEHCGDNETLATTTVVETLAAHDRARFRRLDRLQLRGRIAPVEVHVLERHEFPDLAATMFGNVLSTPAPSALRLKWRDAATLFSTSDMPVILGRGEQATCWIDDNRVSRSHARIDWHGGAFQLVDMSSNGTHVRFAADSEVVTLRRGTCTLHGSGVLGLGASPSDPSAPCVGFEVVRLSDDPLP
jgi:class 3 adenylate cyclase